MSQYYDTDHLRLPREDSDGSSSVLAERDLGAAADLAALQWSGDDCSPASPVSRPDTDTELTSSRIAGHKSTVDTI